MIIRKVWHRVVLAAVVIVVLGGGFALAVFVGAFEKSVVSAAVETPLTAEEIAELAPRGRYVATAADCVACHTAVGGAPWAGGRPFEMPMGTLYATNISPDPTYGIGSWTRADFHRAMRDGVAKGGRHLYPAMPYVSYRQMSEDDVDAVWAYMLTREPMAVPDREDSLPFPYVRQFMTFWNFLNLPGDVPEPDAQKSAAWNRGRYLVDALGHCGECHTPRDITMGMVSSRYLQGAVIEGVDAPDITPAGLARLGFAPERLGDFMRTGMGPEGVMGFAMYDVVHHSTQYLTDQDAAAMAAYLAGEPAPAAPAFAAAPVSPETAENGQRLYIAVCAGCHGIEGEGTPSMAPAMTTNAELRLPRPTNLLAVLADGIPWRDFPHGRLQDMPGFTDLLTDQEIADLSNFLRATWGGRAPDVAAADVTALRRAGD
ncbi:cytochrome c [Pseudoxanthobacter sp. M-2]|uniref:c-type cytochrome n=1 Tax=Pseudoxanthobacter sp. M-2 TaxID=3078754 RepID=UPI0038FC69EB